MRRGNLFAAVFGMIVVWPCCVAMGQLRDQLPNISPTLVRLARDRFGAEFSETDARFFPAVTGIVES